MKSINRHALSALLFGFLTFGASASFSQEASCSSECCNRKPAKAQASTNSYMSQWWKAKFGREYPLNKPAVQSPAASHLCC